MALTGIDVTGRRLVIFDFDGTLANTIDGIVNTARRVMHAHGWDDDALGDMRRIVGPPFPGAFCEVYGVSPEEADKITAEYRAIHTTLGFKGWPLFDGMADLLGDLRSAGKLTATATSRMTDTLERAVRDNDVEGLFDCLEGKRSDVGDDKDVIIARVLDRLGVDSSDAVMVGDRHYDVEASAVHGIPCVGVTYGHTCPVSELEDAGACSIADSVEELRRVLLGKDA